MSYSDRPNASDGQLSVSIYSVRAELIVPNVVVLKEMGECVCNSFSQQN